MATWLLKTEPSDYAWADLERDRRTTWDGVANNSALKHMRKVRKGDRAFIYHTGSERATVGIAEIVSDPYPDPQAAEERLVVFDVAPVEALPRPVTLAEVKADDAFAGFDLTRQPRLSVMPVSSAHWSRIVKLSRDPQT